MKKLFYSLALILFATIAHAGSVRLYNDTSFPLTAEVLSADGKTLGKKEVNEHQTVTWEGGWSGSTTGSETPYTVRWFCKVGGKAYSLCSNVGTGAMVATYMKEKGLEHKIELIRNKKRCRKLKNMYNAIHSCDDNEIIFQLDGDDWLAHEHVFSAISDV